MALPLGPWAGEKQAPVLWSCCQAEDDAKVLGTALTLQEAPPKVLDPLLSQEKGPTRVHRKQRGAWLEMTLGWRSP